MRAPSRRLRFLLARAWSGRDRLALARPHHLVLEVLVERIHALEKRARPAVADLAAIELDDGKDFLRGRADPYFVRRPNLFLRNIPYLQRHGIGTRELHHHVVGDARQDEVALWRREQLARS